MADELTKLESDVRWMMENCFIPVLHETLSTANPKAYEMWQGNACIHTAVFGAWIMESLLQDYTWSVWEGIFKEPIHGVIREYNHAWIYGVQRSTGRRLLIDLSRHLKERLFILVPGNRYPKEHPEYKDMQELSRRKLNYHEMINDSEGFTGRTGFKVLQEILQKGNLLEVEAKKNGIRPY